MPTYIRKTPIILTILLCGLCLSAFSEAKQDKRPAFKDLLDVKLPEHTKRAADKINSFYYNLVDKKVNAVKFRVSDSQDWGLIKKIESRYMITDPDIAKKLKAIRIIATYRPASDALSFEVTNKPEFQAEGLGEIIDKIFISPTVEIYKKLLTEEMACLSPLINPEYDKVQSAKAVDGNLVIEVLNGKNESYWTFDVNYKLKSIEKVDPDKGARIKQTYDLDTFESKYLIKRVTEQTFYRYSKREIDYQLVNGIKIPAKISVFSLATSPNKTTLELYLDDAEVITLP